MAERPPKKPVTSRGLLRMVVLVHPDELEAGRAYPEKRGVSQGEAVRRAGRKVFKLRDEGATGRSASARGACASAGRRVRARPSPLSRRRGCGALLPGTYRTARRCPAGLWPSSPSLFLASTPPPCKLTAAEIRSAPCSATLGHRQKTARFAERDTPASARRPLRL